MRSSLPRVRARRGALGCVLAVAVVVVTSTSSVAAADRVDHRPVAAGMSSRAAARIVVHPIGDSITYGVSRGAGTPGGYRGALAALLGSAGIRTRFVGTSVQNPPNGADPSLVRHDGWSGQRIDELTASLNHPTGLGGGDWLVRTADRGPLRSDVTVVMAGVNDVYQHLDPQHPEAALAAQSDPAAARTFVVDAAHRLYHLVRSIHRLDPGTSVVLCTNVPLELVADADHPADPTISLALDQLIRTRVLDRLRDTGVRVELADVEADFRASGKVRPGVDLSSDGVHPTTAGYAVLAKSVARATIRLTEPTGLGDRRTPSRG